jgi:hypothetical protein
VLLCPECEGERSRRWSRLRRVRSWRFAALVVLMLGGVIGVLWPRRDAVMDRSPSWLVLCAERVGYTRGLEVVAMRAHDGRMPAWTERMFVSQVTERLMEDSAAITWPRSVVLYVYTQLALIDVEEARDGLRRAVVSGRPRAIGDVALTLAYIREDVPGAIMQEARQRRISVDHLMASDRGTLYKRMAAEPRWLVEAFIALLDASADDAAAAQTVLIMRQMFTDRAVADRAMATATKHGWDKAQVSVEQWRLDMNSPMWRRMRMPLVIPGLEQP